MPAYWMSHDALEIVEEDIEENEQSHNRKDKVLKGNKVYKCTARPKCSRGSTLPVG
jgi:hypothetical protein